MFQNLKGHKFSFHPCLPPLSMPPLVTPVLQVVCEMLAKTCCAYRKHITSMVAHNVF